MRIKCTRRKGAEAIDTLRKTNKLNPLLPYPQAPSHFNCEGADFADGGEMCQARKIVREVLEAKPARYVAATDVAAVYVALGDRTQALAWLDKALDEKSMHLHFLLGPAVPAAALRPRSSTHPGSLGMPA